MKIMNHNWAGFESLGDQIESNKPFTHQRSSSIVKEGFRTKWDGRHTQTISAGGQDCLFMSFANVALGKDVSPYLMLFYNNCIMRPYKKTVHTSFGNEVGVGTFWYDVSCKLLCLRVIKHRSPLRVSCRQTRLRLEGYRVVVDMILTYRFYIELYRYYSFLLSNI
jgi:hypothetical protein